MSNPIQVAASRQSAAVLVGRIWRRSYATQVRIFLTSLMVALPALSFAQTLLLQHGIIHTVSGATLTNGSVLIQDGKISKVEPANILVGSPTNAAIIDLNGQHLYPGIIALDTVLGLSEIEAVRATRDMTEVGDFTPDVLSWVAVNPDSELIPVARANGIAYFEAAPRGNIVSGQSALLATDGWTCEQMLVAGPAALHLFWPGMDLNTTPKEKSRDPSKVKSLEDQAKERQTRLRSMEEFFEQAKAYAKARAAAAQGNAVAPEKIPAWDAMQPFVRGELPIVIHADEVRQIRAAVSWATTNQFKVILAGGRDAWMLADLLATNRIPVIYESVFVPPARDTESYDVHFHAPEILHAAGVEIALSFGPSGFAATSLRNLPYAAAQAVAFGLPEAEALKALMLHPAELAGVADRLGSIEIGKVATLFVCDGNLLDLRSNVKRLWIAGKEVSLEDRHTRLYEKYRNRPKP